MPSKGLLVELRVSPLMVYNRVDSILENCNE